MPKPLLITHPDCEHHEMPGHPEKPERLTAVMDLLKGSGLTQDMAVRLATEINDEKLMQVHPKAYINHVVESEPDASWLKNRSRARKNIKSLQNCQDFF